jgi:hypothetical protein
VRHRQLRPAPELLGCRHFHLRRQLRTHRRAVRSTSDVCRPRTARNLQGPDADVRLRHGQLRSAPELLGRGNFHMRRQLRTYRRAVPGTSDLRRHRTARNLQGPSNVNADLRDDDLLRYSDLHRCRMRRQLRPDRRAVPGTSDLRWHRIARCVQEPDDADAAELRPYGDVRCCDSSLRHVGPDSQVHRYAVGPHYRLLDGVRQRQGVQEQPPVGRARPESAALRRRCRCAYLELRISHM